MTVLSVHRHPGKKGHETGTMVFVDNKEVSSKEEERLKEDRQRTKYWKKWGPYTAERQWATVREDYS